MDHRNDMIAFNPDPEIPFRIVFNLVRHLLCRDNRFIIKRGFAPPPLLLEDEEIDPEILGIGAVLCKRHHLRCPPHLPDRSPGLVGMLAREDDRRSHFHGHPGQEGIHAG